MRTVRGVPECSLLNGRRFAALVTYSCEDESEPRVERTFVDIAPGRLERLLRIDEAIARFALPNESYSSAMDENIV